MSDAAVAPAKTAQKKKAASKPKVPAEHPKYSEMITQAVGALKERGGSSRQAILKYIVKNFKVGNDEKMVNARIKLALKSGVKSGTLKQSKGTGATGSFRVGEKKTTEKPKKAKKPKTAAKKSPKKAKKPAGDAKKVAKTKKAAKPAAQKKTEAKPAKKAAAKQSVKKAAAKPAAKKAAAKPAAKKAATKPKTSKPKKAAPAKTKKAPAKK